MTQDAGETGIGTLLDGARNAVRSGDWSVGLERLNRAFQRLPREGTADDAVEVLRWTGHIHRMRGDYEVGRELYGAALAVAEAAGLPGRAGSALNDLGNIAQLEGRLDAARELYRAALDAASGQDDLRLAAMAEQNLGVLASIQGDVDGALAHYEGALIRYEAVEDHLAAAWALNNIGMAHVARDRFDAARVSLERALAAAERAEDVNTIANVHLNLAELGLKAGELARAWDACERAFELYGRVESKIGLAETYRLYGALHKEAGKAELAEAHLSVVANMARQSQDVLLEAEVESDRALLHQSEGRSRDALVALNRAHELFKSLEARPQIADLERRLDLLEQKYLMVVQAWGESIEAKDGYTAGHCGRVAHLTCLLAEDMGFTERELRWIRMGAFLHDVGKTSVPAEILNKPGSLTPAEWDVIKGHTTAGDALVAEVGFPWDIRPMVRNHHERWDGSGYPDGLAGEEIPVLARVLCTADIYDALTTERSYRPAMSREDALEVMREESGQTLDPELFRRFERLVRSGAVDAPAVAG